ncbi:hypothetical protein SARC_15265, partial [Sphaeroforma arctica JP610]
ILDLVSSHGATVVDRIEDCPQYWVTKKIILLDSSYTKEKGMALMNSVKIVSITAPIGCVRGARQREWVSESIDLGEIAPWAPFHLGCKPIFEHVVATICVVSFNKRAPASQICVFNRP